MPNTPPDHCPDCGGRLEPVDPPAVQRCGDCGEYEFFNPIPTARVAVLDGTSSADEPSRADETSVLLAKVDVPDRDLWGTPGGMVEAGEDPDVAGARELDEETTLTVDPDDLALFDARTFVKFEATHKTCLCYAVDYADVSGTPRADDEVAAARFWTPAELAAADGHRLLTSWPESYKRLEWWVEEGRAALDRAGAE
ncbi:NUDIX hydrolase [Halosimplex pelagicum]|uniref:NUDIX domain-containing protein n=1 Tax=Halosimplex pelagicum TaxID=869886 RepID=A0A7D5TC83_9EURY|nr:NUDIX domain-containing protein [Halosimplex pelagicum]QLH82729.1 NUDIX domain-containing protein [Halosimplex pelagicum]